VPFFVPFRVGRARTGLGLFATVPIAKGTWVVEYRGPILTDEDAKKREDRGDRYLFEINKRWTIDGSPRRNLARYANHSCRPNMEAEIIQKRVLLRAIRRIEPGDELTYNYGRDYLENYIPVCKCVNCKGHKRRGRKANGKNGHANGR
jgi:uncharacterized protein